MPLFDRDNRTPADSPGATPLETSAVSESSSDAEASAARIAELVRRTTQRQASPAAPPTPRPEATLTEPLMPPPAPAPAQRATPGVTPPSRPGLRRPPLRVLVAGGAAAAALVLAGAFTLSRADSPPAAGSAAPIASTTAPPVYTVRVTDVITSCLEHSHGRTKSSFRKENCVKATRFLASGKVSGRPAVFVMSRIQMATAEAAASVKQVLDSTGTGNLNDLLREGRSFQGAPGSMPASGYASVQTGPVVVVAEAGFIQGPSASANPALRAAAAQAAAQLTAQR